MILKTAEGLAFLEVLVSDKRCEEHKMQQCDCKVKLEPCKGDGCKKPCPEWIEGLVMESSQSKLFRVCLPTDIHGCMTGANKGNGKELTKGENRVQDKVAFVE